MHDYLETWRSSKQAYLCSLWYAIGRAGPCSFSIARIDRHGSRNTSQKVVGGRVQYRPESSHDNQASSCCAVAFNIGCYAAGS